MRQSMANRTPARTQRKLLDLHRKVVGSDTRIARAAEQSASTPCCKTKQPNDSPNDRH